MREFFENFWPLLLKIPSNFKDKFTLISLVINLACLTTVTIFMGINCSVGTDWFSSLTLKIETPITNTLAENSNSELKILRASGKISVFYSKNSYRLLDGRKIRILMVSAINLNSNWKHYLQESNYNTIPSIRI